MEQKSREFWFIDFFGNFSVVLDNSEKNPTDFAPIRADFRTFFEMAKITKMAKMTAQNSKIVNSDI